MTAATAASLTGTFSRLATSLEALALKLARLERAVEAAGAQVDRATDAAREVGSAAEAVQQTLEMVLTQPREEEAAPAPPTATTAPRAELLAALNGTPTAEAPPCPAPVASEEAQTVQQVDDLATPADEAREEEAVEGLEAPAPKGKRDRRRR